MGRAAEKASTTMMKHQARDMRSAICTAVYRGEISNMTTHEVATRFGCSDTFALRVLLSIVNNTSGDERFVPNEERNLLPTIGDGRTFFNGVDSMYSLSSTRRPFKYYWMVD